MSPRILALDIETAPSLAYVWGLFKENISIGQIAEVGRTLCFAAKWLGQKKIHFYSEWGEEDMLEEAWALLDQADLVLHYNGKKFDMPTLSREFVLNDIAPPSPYKQIDLLEVVRREFRFQSNKLDFVSQQLGIGAKIKHKGFDLWKEVMAGDSTAQRQMMLYNKQDVALLEDLYERLKPWVGRSQPNMGVYGTGAAMSCAKCGSTNVMKRGFAYTNTGKYQQIQCNDCHGYSRMVENLLKKDFRDNLGRNVA